MCDDCYDAVLDENTQLEARIEQLKAELEISRKGRDDWYEEYRKAETALLEMNQLAVNAPYQYDKTWVVPANDIHEVFERWVDGKDD